MQGDAITMGMQVPRNAGADPARAAGDQGHPLGFCHLWFPHSAILCIVPVNRRIMHADLPTPDSEALAHSQQLADHLRADIFAQGGAVPFSRFMELALYAPGWGYYSAGASKFGAAGDFVTSPEMGSLFAATTANALAPVLQQLGPQARMLELGGGSGAFAEVMLKRLHELDALPARYAILEPSADLRERQRERLAKVLRAEVFARSSGWTVRSMTTGTGWCSPTR